MDDDASGPLTLSQWWERSLYFLRSFWRSYILEYNTQQQAEVAQALWGRLALGSRIEAFSIWVQREPYWLAGLTALLVGLIWLRRPKARLRQNGPAPEIAFYHRLLRVLKRYCRLVPQVGQTPQEFGAIAQEFLAAQRVETDLKDLPLRVIELFYKVRYGRMMIPPDQRQEIDRQLELLSAALNKNLLLAK